MQSSWCWVMRGEPRIKTIAAQCGARAVRRERCVEGAGSSVVLHVIRCGASSCVLCPVDTRCADRDARTAGLTRRPENSVRRRCPPVRVARVFPATHTISSAELLNWHQV
ncbi:hypothetical protein DF107_28190 [Burkholderia stagnalis]|uniref:Uncharacterized protein n=1 Tax=Burkholderia stagnalis TaxID=1503054 RepID=A0A3N7YWC6_9BURK|nr:hypothetical protein F7R25_26135 [Burkholderia stagnalis]RQQ04276.1 hypothetical protein DF164_21650 [Burkholderia stagnalis]RQQ10634.1 hypothetical protein DF161_25240 [Burkholderia stagnalis]RQQ24700.1 hypothetical protein DF163_24445 [Burkholderia stagnalis]RQQ27047.1 hypothetical protein DF149_23815 [Burkholderia stagnalis]